MTDFAGERFLIHAKAKSGIYLLDLAHQAELLITKISNV